MTTLCDLKLEILNYQISDPSHESKYGKFLDKMALEYDLRGKVPAWDLWYYSDNTEFCRDSAGELLRSIECQVQEYLRFSQSPNTEPSAPHAFRVLELRRCFGSFLFYMYASLESFAQEINIFYELPIFRRNVSIWKIGKSINPDKSIYSHLQSALYNDSMQLFRKYRNTVMHGYVFPLSMDSNGIFIKESPQQEPFTFQGHNRNILDFL